MEIMHVYQLAQCLETVNKMVYKDFSESFHSKISKKFLIAPLTNVTLSRNSVGY